MMHGDVRETGVLLQESDPDLSRVVAEMLEHNGWRVVEAAGEETALAELDNEPHPTVLIVEYRLQDGAADRIIQCFRAGLEDDGKVLVTTEDRPPDAWRRDIQPDAVVYKPFDTRYLVKSLETITRAD